MFHSGLYGLEYISKEKEEIIYVHIQELFSNFSGLIVIDDIDSLSRRGVDTEEEVILLSMLRSNKKIRFFIR